MGGPYRPSTALVGGVPTVKVDVPICAVFLLLFLGGAVGHMGLFQINKRRNHEFIPSAMTFGFCMSRLIANSVRIAWACHPDNIRLGIASQIFVAAGVVLLFILNLLFAQRILRSMHPRVGWSRVVSLLFKALYISIILCIAMIITVVVQSFYTLNMNTHRIDHDVQLAVITLFAIITFLPLPIVAGSLLIPNNNRKDKEDQGVEKFGTGSLTAKAVIVCSSGVLLCLGASFRAATSWEHPVPITHPAWYDTKACFYCFNFMIEIIVVYFWLFARVDQRFHVPNGSSKVGHYRGTYDDEHEHEQKETMNTPPHTKNHLEDDDRTEDHDQSVDNDHDLESGPSSPSRNAITALQKARITVDSVPSTLTAVANNSVEEVTKTPE